MSPDDFDDWIGSPIEVGMYCELHGETYEKHCPHCADDEADRRYDAQKEQQP